MIQTSTQAIYFYLVLLPIFISVHADNEIEVLRNLHSAYPDWKPRGIVDVGANGGGWTRAVQEEGLYPGVKIFMVEAFQYHSGSLEETKKTFADGDVDYAIAVLSSKDGESVKFHSIKNNDFSTGNSMFIEQTEHYNNNDAIFEYVNTTKLDTLLEDKMEHIDYLKLDVQGAELMVLLGATETLKKATFVQFEVSVIEYNKGGACWHEVDELLRKKGFFFYDSGDHNRMEAFHTKAIGQFDALYIKPSSHHMPSWLVDNKAVFCGSNQEGIGGGVIKKGKNICVDVTDVATRGEMLNATLHVYHTSSVLIFFVAIFAFVGGYLAGKKSRVKVYPRKLW